MARRVGRGGAAVGADRRGQDGGAWRGGLVPPVFRGLGGARGRPGLRCRARRGDGPQRRRGRPPRRRRRTRAGQGRAPPPRRTPTRRCRRLGAVPGIGKRAPLRVRWPRGLGCGRPQARAKLRERGGRRLRSGRRAAFSDASAASRASSAASFREPSRRPEGRICRLFAWRLGRAPESCPIMQSYRTSPTPRQAGRIILT